jgi:hypothetical protein
LPPGDLERAFSVRGGWELGVLVVATLGVLVVALAGFAADEVTRRAFAGGAGGGMTASRLASSSRRR